MSDLEAGFKALQAKQSAYSRYWDLAATAKSLAKSDPDYTAGVRMMVRDGVYYITDVLADQMGPMDTENLFLATSEQDALDAERRGLDYAVRWEIEPGSAGKREARRMVSALSGMDAKGIPSRGDKVTRAKAFLAQAEAGNVLLVRGPWNDRWLTHMHNQPNAPHDDIWDATAGVFNALVGVKQGQKAKAEAWAW